MNNKGLICNSIGCVVGCREGFIGKDCDVFCSEYCVEKNNSICSNEIGECLYGCK